MAFNVSAAPFIQSREEAELTWFFGGQNRIRVTSAQTGGNLAVIEQLADPGLGSPYHIHHNEDEEFYIISGQLRFVSGDESWIGGAGTFAFLPGTCRTVSKSSVMPLPTFC